MDYDRARKVAYVFSFITEDESHRCYEDMLSIWDLDGAKEWFLDNSLPWAAILDEDIQRIIEGDDPIYFMSPEEYVDVYRYNNHIFLGERRGGTMMGWETQDYLKESLECDRLQKERFGVTLWKYSEGHACPAEMQHFYQSDEWQRMAKVVRYLGKNKCNICGKRNVPLHAHHDSPIISAYYENFRWNFSDHKLEALCEGCHHDFHKQRVRSYGHSGFDLATREEIMDEKRENALLKKAHDELKFCPFCFGYKPGWSEMYENWPNI